MQSTSNKLRLRENEEIQMHIFDQPNNSTEQNYEFSIASFSQYDTWLHFVSIISGFMCDLFKVRRDKDKWNNGNIRVKNPLSVKKRVTVRVSLNLLNQGGNNKKMG